MQLARIYKSVIATDTSPKQLELAPKLPNIRYEHTPADMSVAQVEKKLTPESSLDLVTVAQALHWFDLPSFYKQAKWALKKPEGIVAAWCYTVPRVDASFDRIMDRFYAVDSEPYWDPQRKLIDGEYRGLEFPFEAVDGVDGTGPVEFVSEKLMDFEGFLGYIRSWSAYQTAKEKGVDLLADRVVEDFRKGWEGDEKKVVKFPLFLRIGKVGENVDC